MSGAQPLWLEGLNRAGSSEVTFHGAALGAEMLPHCVSLAAAAKQAGNGENGEGAEKGRVQRSQLAGPRQLLARPGGPAATRPAGSSRGQRAGADRSQTPAAGVGSSRVSPPPRAAPRPA